MRSRITGLGHYLPEKIYTNKAIEKKLNTNDEWIQERSGIKERRWTIGTDDNNTTMAVKASKNAIKDAGIAPGDIDFVIAATLSPDYDFPGPSTLVQSELGLGDKGAVDIRVQCSGFLYGITIADSFIKTGLYKNILVVAVENHSSILDLTPRGRNVSVLFGDAGAAAVVQPSEDENRGILSSHLHADGKKWDQLFMRKPKIRYAERTYEDIVKEEDELYMQMNGNFVFKQAVKKFEEVLLEGLSANELQPEDLDYFVPHQANLRITNYVKKKLNLPDEKVFSNIHRYGNTSAASIPLALSEMNQLGKLQAEKLIALASFGAGFTWASVIIRW